MNRRNPGAFAIALATLSLVLPEYSRSADLAEAPPDGSIGFIICKSGGQRNATTATVVENRLTVLTVAHFNSDGKGGKIPESDCRFGLGDPGRPGSRSYGLTISRRGGDAIDNKLSRATDWALLKLEEPVPATVEPMHLRPAQDTAPSSALLEGYEGNRQYRLVRFSKRTCSFDRKGSKALVVYHNCPTARGSSGAPLFTERRGRREIVALHVGRASNAGLAVAFSKRMIDAPAERGATRLAGAIGVPATGGK